MTSPDMLPDRILALSYLNVPPTERSNLLDLPVSVPQIHITPSVEAAAMRDPLATECDPPPSTSGSVATVND